MKIKQVIADFRVTSMTEMYDKLEAAVAAACIEAVAGRNCGILVTRHELDHFSVALSVDVPFGLIREHDYANRNLPHSTDTFMSRPDNAQRPVIPSDRERVVERLLGNNHAEMTTGAPGQAYVLARSGRAPQP